MTQSQKSVHLLVLNLSTLRSRERPARDLAEPPSAPGRSATVSQLYHRGKYALYLSS